MSNYKGKNFKPEYSKHNDDKNSKPEEKKGSKDILTEKLDNLLEIESKISACKFSNFNEERISIGKLCQKYLNKEDLNLVYSCYSTELFNVKILKKKYLSDVRVKYWLHFSSNVITNKSLGFPIVYKLISTEATHVLLFENLKKNLYQIKSTDVILDKNVYNYIMFQKLFIVYQMYLNNCYSDFFIFKVYNVPRTKIIFKVKDIFFEFEISKLVMLSEETDFTIQHDLGEDIYISKITDNDFTMRENTHFIKAFLYNFSTNISMFYVLSKIPPIIEEQKLNSYNQGEYACLKIKDNIISVIILSDFDDLCEVVQILPNSNVIMNVNKDQLIRKPRVMFNKLIKNYVIGEEDY